jgi:spermidine/putrescine transport system ATP-binding protein
MAGGEVQLVDLVKRFGEFTAVAGINLEMPSGEFFSLLGPSGCGKTTTLRMIAGFERPTEGQILLDEVDMAQTPPHKRNVNTVFQNYALFPHLTVEENVAFGLKYQKASKEESAERVGKALELVQMSQFSKRRPNQLSGGQQQRVALARALILNPKVLLLDEPLGALDLKLRKQMQLELKRIQQEVGITFLYVTHDQEEAMTMSNRLAVMRHGMIEQIGEPEHVYEHPATEFVAGFLGASNLLEGEVKEVVDGTATVVLTEGGVVRVPSEKLNGVGPQVKLGVRPEKIRVEAVNGEPPADWNAVEGVLRVSTFIGVSHQFTVDGPEGKTLTVYAQNLGSEVVPAQGERIRLLWRPEHTFVVQASAPLAEWEEEQ